MKDEIEKLKKRILELEETLDDKDIVINALLKDIKRRKTHKIPEILNNEIKQIKSEEIASTCEEKVITNETVTIKKDLHWIYKYKLKDDLENCFNRKKIVRIFKTNIFFDEFVDFCADVYVLKSFEVQKISHCKNISKYLQENKSKIVKYLILNINKLSFTSVCSSLLALSSEFNNLEKCVIIHDIILYINDFSKLIFYAFCILNGEKLGGSDLLCTTLFNILSFQYLVDIEIHKSKKLLISSYSTLSTYFNFNINKSLEDFLFSIDRNIPVILKCKINLDIYQYIYSIRVLCHFLDWDYVYNTYILEELSKDITECKLLYMGIITFNSVRLFGTTESSDIIFNFIRNQMTNTTNIGVVSYLIYKQVDELNSQSYLESNKDELIKVGYDINYLSKLIIY